MGKTIRKSQKWYTNHIDIKLKVNMWKLIISYYFMNIYHGNSIERVKFHINSQLFTNSPWNLVARANFQSNDETGIINKIEKLPGWLPMRENGRERERLRERERTSRRLLVEESRRKFQHMLLICRQKMFRFDEVNW